MIAIIDYGMGNLRSVQKAMEKFASDVLITDAPSDIFKADKVVLPGVGAIQPAMKKLESLGLIEPIKQVILEKKPFLGICLGLQLLFEKSDEGGAVQGLGILNGSVDLFRVDKKTRPEMKIPHMGWNSLTIKKADCPLFKDIDDQSYVYFCHSYFVNPDDSAIEATTTLYAQDFTSSIWKDNVFAVQFHPEKSQAMGLKILENFTKI